MVRTKEVVSDLLIENGQVVESRKLPGKSMAYVNDVCENWNNGIIQLLVD